MNDPHVACLYYCIETAETLSFDNPPTLTGTTDSFDWRLEGGKLILSMKQHFASIEEAKQDVRDFVRGWELDSALREGRVLLRFVYERADVIDRNPPPPSSPIVGRLNATLGPLTGSLTARVTRREYPEPPHQFRASPDVEILWQRYSRSDTLRGK